MSGDNFRRSPHHNSPNNEKPTISVRTIVLTVIFLIFGGLVIFSILTSNTQALLNNLAILLSILCLLPAIGLARRIFKSRLGQSLKGNEENYPVYTGKQFTFSIRRTKRPWWYYPLLFILGWIVIILILVSTN